MIDCQNTVKELELEKDRLQTQIIAIDTALSALAAVAGKGYAPPPPERIGKRGRRRSTKSQPMAGNTGPVLRSHDQDLGKVDTSQMSKAEKKKYYQQRWMAKKNAQSNGSSKYAADPAKVAGKFDLGREFSLDNKDVSLMNSYLISWKGTGRLEEAEVLSLRLFEMRDLKALNEADRVLLRTIFYSCRGRVMSQSKRLSNV